MQPSAHAFFGLSFSVDHALSRFFPATSEIPRPGVTISTTTIDTSEDEDWQVLYRSAEVRSDDPAPLVIDRASTTDSIRISYGGSTRFVINRAPTEVGVSWTAPSTPGDAATYLLGPVVGLLLYFRGQTCLHASAIAYRGKAFAFVGAAETGKSTLAAAFARMGQRVLGDDILLLKRRGCGIAAYPGIPRIGLWPQSVRHFWDSDDALPRQVATWEKRHLDLVKEGVFQDSPLPIGAIYLLADREPDISHRIASLAGTDAVLALIANRYVTCISQRNQEKRDFVLLSELAASVPVRRVNRSDRLSDLNATCEAILADCDALARTAD